MRKMNSLTNRIVALLLSIVMVLGMIPAGAFAVVETSAYATVEGFTNGVTIQSAGAEVKATYGGTLSWVKKDESIGRMSDGWWVGLKVIAPQTINMDTAKYTSGNDVKLFKDYKDSADDAAEQWIGMWGLVKEDYLRSAGQTDGLSTYTWTFDWDGDGVFEQTLILDIEASRTRLLDSEGKQVYPAPSVGNGVVSGITAGSAIASSGNTTTVTYANITLEWNEKDPAAGRNQDGWWVGMKITAPETLTKEADFINVTYQSYGANGWSAAKSFWNAQDSDKNAADTTRFLTMWGLITPELVAKDNDGIMTYQYRFDWNKDGIYEQTLFLKIEADTIKLMKDGVQQMLLKYGVAESLTGGNVTGSASADSVITYENITLNWSAADPTVGRGQDGWWIGAKITAPEGMTTEAACKNINYQRYDNGEWSEAKSFWNAQDSDKNAADTARFLTMWGLVTPELIEKDNDGILTYQYRFDWNQDGEYEQQLTLNIDASKVTLLNKDGVQIHPVLGVVTPLTSGEVTGSGTGEAIVEIKDVTLTWSEANAEIGRLQDGWWTGIKVTAPASADLEKIQYRRKTGDGWTSGMKYAPDDGTQDTMQLWGLVTADYLDQFIALGRNMNYTWQFDWNGDGTFEQTVIMSVDPTNIILKQAGFAFAVDTDTVTYGSNNNVYTILAPTGGQAGTLKYEVSDLTVATPNDNGTLTILKAGTVEIVATLSDAHYEAITDTYVLIIEKAEQSFTFNHKEVIDEKYGLTTFQTDLTCCEKNSGKITYTCSENTIGATVDEAGLVTFGNSAGKVGSVTITATMVGDDCYEEFSKSYVINLDYLTTNEKPVDDGDKNNDSGWHVDRYVIKAPENFLIAYDNALDTVFNENVSVLEEGIQNKNVYLKDANGYITDAIPVEDLMLDTTDPVNLSIRYNEPNTFVKFLEKLFGIYNEETKELTVYLSAEDAVSGIDTLIYYSNGEEFIVDYNGENSITYPVTIQAQYKDTIKMQVVDMAGRTSMLEDDKELVLDTKKPELITPSYWFESDQHREVDGIYYTQGKVEVTFTIEETNFQLVENPVVELDGSIVKLEWTQLENKDQWQATLPISGDADHTVEVSYVDASTNQMDVYTKQVHIDSKSPEIEVSYKGNDAKNDKYFVGDRTATVTITEHNFKPEEVILTVTAEDVTGKKLVIPVEEYANYAKNPENWVQDGDTWTLKEMVFSAEARYTVTVEYADLAENKAKSYSESFVIDNTVPQNVEIRYSEPVNDVWGKILDAVTFGYYPYKEKVEVTLIAEDITAGVDFFTWTYTQEEGTSNTNQTTVTKVIEREDIQFSEDRKTATATFEIESLARGSISVVATDMAGNAAGKSDDTRINVVDNVAPKRTVSYTPDRVLDATTMLDVTDFEEGKNVILYYEKSATVTFAVEEANFYAEDVVICVNGTEMVPTDWTQNGDVWTGTITLAGDGEYVVTMTYVDRSTNEMVPYTSQKIIIDDTDPTIAVSYNDIKVVYGNIYGEDRVATITIVDENFRADDVKATVTAVDIQGNAITSEELEDFGKYLSQRGSWEKTENGYEAVITYSVDAIYTFDIAYADILGNKAADFAEQTFVIDHTPPQNIQIKYSEPVNDPWTKILNAVTFGYYPYREKVEVTLIAEDLTSGVDFFTWTYTQEEGTSDTNQETVTEVIEFSEDGKTATATFVIDAQARGHISVVATDMAGNAAGKSDDTRINVVDNVAPKRTVSYTPDRVLDAATMLDVTDFEEGKNVILYHEESATVTFTVEEANFYAEDVVIRVNGKEMAPTDWTQNRDVWTGTITLEEDGKYIVTMTYVDRSTNEMVPYTSQQIVVDDTDPIITVSYDNNNAQYGNNYKADRVATITIVDENFRADDVKATVTAEDILHNAITSEELEDFGKYLSQRDSWQKTENGYEAKITYSVDAFYTFDITYADILGNEAADFEKQTFVIDHTAPENIKITYSTSVLAEIMEKLTFGFYQADIIVTVTAEDLTSGVDYFALTYTKDPTASNAHKDTFKVDLKDVTANGKVFTASYTVPAQARGSFYVKVYDKAGNSSEQTDTDTKYVDTIKPEVDVQFAPVNANKTLYFVDDQQKPVANFKDGVNAFCKDDVKATVTITEANFFPKDIVFEVTKIDDQGNEPETIYEAADLDWKPGTQADTYTASVIFPDNGDYKLTMQYTDRSGNPANFAGADGNTGVGSYISKVVTVDETAPEITVEYKYENAETTEAPKTTFDADVQDTPVNETGREYFGENRITVITVKEHNFRADDIRIAVDAKDFDNQDVKYVKDENDANDATWTELYAAQGIDRGQWTAVAGEADTHQLTLVHSADANYTFDIDYTDMAGNAAADYEMTRFTVDATKPDKEEATITFDGYVVRADGQEGDPLYYGDYAKIRLEAVDPVSGVKYFSYRYKLNPGVSGINVGMEKAEKLPAMYDKEKKVFYATFTVPAAALDLESNQFNGTIDFTIHDHSENTSDVFADTTTLIVDSIRPQVNITYNAPVRTANDISYYDGNINATIAIVEANFDSNDVVIKVTRNGEPYTIVTEWTDDPNNKTDNHFGTFTLNQDGDYVVTVSYTDKSGNVMLCESKTVNNDGSYSSNQLTRDTVKPTIKVSNIKANSANKDEEYGFQITVDDINMNASTLKPVLKGVVKDETGKYVTVEMDLGDMETVVSGKTYTYTVKNLPQDGLYTLTCYVEDMSANGTSAMILEDGESYEKVQFSINREGSTYVYGDTFTEDLVGKYYVYSVDEDVVIEEINVDPIEDYKVSLNGKELTEGTDYTTTQTSKDGEWSKRTYTLNKALFAEEGEYSIIVSSTDKADTTAFSDVKNLTLAFVVDQTAPVLTISGLENGGRYQVEEQIVTIIPTDDGGRLNSIKVVVLDSDGQPLKDESGLDISVRFEMSGEEFLTYLNENGGMVTFTVPEGLENQVQIICNDCAINAAGGTNAFDETFTKVTVSQSQWIIFYANKPLFYGTIAGVVLLAGGITALIIFLKKKKAAKK